MLEYIFFSWKFKIINHSSDIDSKECTVEPYSFVVNNTILPSDNPLKFWKNILK